MARVVMADDFDERVRQRAYEIWESEGHPHGREQQHWERARRELADQRAPAADDKPRSQTEPAGTARAPSGNDVAESGRTLGTGPLGPRRKRVAPTAPDSLGQRRK